jgi:hypothetical protein
VVSFHSVVVGGHCYVGSSQLLEEKIVKFESGKRVVADWAGIGI